MSDDVSFLSKLVRDSMELQAQEALNNAKNQDFDVMKPLQVNLLMPLIYDAISGNILKFTLNRLGLLTWYKTMVVLHKN